MEKQGVLVLDFDGVIADTELSIITYINKRYGKGTIDFGYRNEGHLVDLVNKKTGLNLSSDEFYLDFTKNYVMCIDAHKDVMLLPYVFMVLPKLAKKYDLSISTQRNSSGHEVLTSVLENNNIRGYFKSIHYVHSLDEEERFVEDPKIDFIKSFNGEVKFFVDDSISEIRKTKDIVPSILLGHGKIPGFLTANSWYDLADLLLL